MRHVDRLVEEGPPRPEAGLAERLVRESQEPMVAGCPMEEQVERPARGRMVGRVQAASRDKHGASPPRDRARVARAAAARKAGQRPNAQDRRRWTTGAPSGSNSERHGARACGGDGRPRCRPQTRRHAPRAAHPQREWCADRAKAATAARAQRMMRRVTARRSCPARHHIPPPADGARRVRGPRDPPPPGRRKQARAGRAGD